MSSASDKQIAGGSAPGTRIDPLLPPDWGEAAHDALNTFPAARDFLLTAWRSGRTGIQGLNLMGTQLLHPTLALEEQRAPQ